MTRKNDEPIALCNHVKAKGTCCASPALKNEPFCFFHASVRERTRRMRRAARKKLPLQLPVLEDHETIQLAIGDTLNALLAGQIDHKTAGLLLYGLQTAAGNMHKVSFRGYSSDRAFAEYHNQEEERLEREIEAEIAAEQRSEQEPAAAAPAVTPAPLPPKKAPAAATEDELVDIACKLAQLQVENIQKKVARKE